MRSVASVLVLAASFAFVGAGVASAQDANTRGEELFKQCAACHSIEKDGEVIAGPNLWGVYGAKAAGKDDFSYSPALKASGLTWTDENLDKWLAGPTKFVPGAIMAFPGFGDPADRKAVIAYLKSHGG